MTATLDIGAGETDSDSGFVERQGDGKENRHVNA